LRNQQTQAGIWVEILPWQAGESRLTRSKGGDRGRRKELSARQQDPDVGSDREITEVRDLGAEVEASDGVKDGD
jgi:hypothetical protein